MGTLSTRVVHWALKVPFTISRDTITSVACIQATITDDKGVRGRGEAVGIDYAGETPATMLAQIEQIRPQVEKGTTRAALLGLLPYGGARNVLDCALWDLEAKQSGVPAWRAAGLSEFVPRPTSFTFGIMDEAALRETARRYAHYPLLKIKTNRERGLDPVRIIHEECPRSRFIVDPNQAWGAAELDRFAGQFVDLNVAVLEQPVVVAEDEVLRGRTLPIPVAADEAFNTRKDIPGFVGKYQVLNIKLDKTGGLTEALACAAAGKAAGFDIMVGCMVGSSLSMAPGTVIAQLCRFVDLDGPLLQADDCDNPIVYRDGLIGTPTPALWG